MRRKGWAFERTADRLKYAQQDYESCKHTTLADYAEKRYELDQVHGAP